MLRCSSARLVLVAITASVVAAAASAELASTSFRQRGGHVASGGASAASASFSSTSVVGSGGPVGPSGSAQGLGTNLSGFPPILAGTLPSLDLDGDGAAYFLDADDDGDGLDDVVETNSGVFGSSSNTGSDSLIEDTDGDGVGDGVEVDGGSDPNDPQSLPGVNPLPLIATLGRVTLALLIGVWSLFALRLRAQRTC